VKCKNYNNFILTFVDIFATIMSVSSKTKTYLLAVRGRAV
jgi:hypothetical protein